MKKRKLRALDHLIVALDDLRGKEEEQLQLLIEDILDGTRIRLVHTVEDGWDLKTLPD